ncbi:MAG: biopolymer transporter Tol, partial [candidate division WOR-3 bacterium]
MKKMIFLFLFVISLSTFSQTTNFGKNKIQYKDYNWKVGYTEHFNIYYYQGAESLFNFVSIVAESSIARLQEEFNYKIKNKIPIVLYNSHKDFEETNITVEILDEFVGGFTESVKNRVVLPFTGSYEDLRHVV